MCRLQECENQASMQEGEDSDAENHEESDTDSEEEY